MFGYMKLYDKYTPLMDAVRENSFEKVKKLVEDGHNIHESGEGAMFEACKENNKEILNYLLEKGANIHHQYDSLLGCASAYGHHDIINFLLDKGLNINTEKGYVLRCALASKKYNTVLFLLEKGASYIIYLSLVKEFNLQIPKIYEAAILSFIDSQQYSLTYRKVTIEELNNIDSEINVLTSIINADVKKYFDIVSKLNAKIENLKNENIINVNIVDETLKKETLSKKIMNLSEILELVKLKLRLRQIKFEKS